MNNKNWPSPPLWSRNCLSFWLRCHPSPSAENHCCSHAVQILNWDLAFVFKQEFARKSIEHYSMCSRDVCLITAKITFLTHCKNNSYPFKWQIVQYRCPSGTTFTLPSTIHFTSNSCRRTKSLQRRVWHSTLLAVLLLLSNYQWGAACPFW